MLLRSHFGGFHPHYKVSLFLCRANQSSEPILPKFNQDQLFYTPAFVNPYDQVTLCFNIVSGDIPLYRLLGEIKGKVLKKSLVQFKRSRRRGTIGFYFRRSHSTQGMTISVQCARLVSKAIGHTLTVRLTSEKSNRLRQTNTSTNFAILTRRIVKIRNFLKILNLLHVQKRREYQRMPRKQKRLQKNKFTTRRTLLFVSRNNSSRTRGSTSTWAQKGLTVWHKRNESHLKFRMIFILYCWFFENTSSTIDRLPWFEWAKMFFL